MIMLYISGHDRKSKSKALTSPPDNTEHNQVEHSVDQQYPDDPRLTSSEPFSLILVLTGQSCFEGMKGSNIISDRRFKVVAVCYCNIPAKKSSKSLDPVFTERNTLTNTY